MIRRFLWLFCILLPGLSWADKIIMKDGTTYEGVIMGENRREVLISNAPADPKPHFLELKDVDTIVRERHPPVQPSLEEQRFVSVTAGVVGQMYSSKTFSFSPAPSLYAGGAIRVHPAVELGGEFFYTPSLTGTGLTVSDGTNSRSYDSFDAYEGGFSTKLFPFFKHRTWRAEPYLTSGYHWSRLVPKASGDELKGQSLFGGAGVLIPWWKPLYWDFRFTYTHTSYDSIQFLGGNGSLSGVSNDSYSLLAGLSYRFL